jgi:hypothetical protein
LRAPIRTGLGQLVNQPVSVQVREALCGERRSGTVAQQPLQSLAVVGRDTHRRVQAESAAVRPLFHLVAAIFVQYPAPCTSAQDAVANPGLDGFGVVCIQLLSREEASPLPRIGLDYAVADADMEVGMQVERGAEAMDDTAPARASAPAPGLCARRWRSISLRKIRRAQLRALRSRCR